MRRLVSIMCCAALVCSFFAGLLQAPSAAKAAGTGDVLQLDVTNGAGAASRYIYKRFSNKGYTFQM
jgi:hypothetical protein